MKKLPKKGADKVMDEALGLFADFARNVLENNRDDEETIRFLLKNYEKDLSGVFVLGFINGWNTCAYKIDQSRKADQLKKSMKGDNGKK